MTVTEPADPTAEPDDALAELADAVRIHPATARVRAPSPAELPTLVKQVPARQSSPFVRFVGSVAFSTLFHLILVGIALLVAGTAVYMARDDEESPIIIADFNAAAYDPINAALPAASDQPLSKLGGTRGPSLTPDVPADSLSAIADLGVIAASGSRLSASDFAPRGGGAGAGTGGGSGGGVQFIGLRAGTNARDIIYVIDASGSMIPTFQFIVDELARSMDQLTEDQRFAVVFFQRNTALWAPPANTLMAATTAEKRRVIAWVREHVIPANKSNPLAALEAALVLKPQAIFLLSSNITGMGEFEIDQADLLTMLDRLNPANLESGARPVQINCLQFIENDPLGTLQKIAALHSGPNGYRSVSRADLGLPEE